MSQQPDLRTLRQIRHIVLDLDDTLYCGNQVFPYTGPFLEILNALGISRTFMTNNSSLSNRDYISKLENFGITATEDEVFTSTNATIVWLNENLANAKKLLLVGTESVAQQFQEGGFSICHDWRKDEPDAVVVGFDLELTHTKLSRAAYWVSRGKPYIATHPDRVCPSDEPTLLVDCGSICAAINSATDRVPDVIPGKPHRLMLETLVTQLGLDAQEVAMVGDRLYTDITMAGNAGVVSVLVLSGEASVEDTETLSIQPNFILNSVKELGEQLALSRS